MPPEFAHDRGLFFEIGRKIVGHLMRLMRRN
jgi:hypothetical protein